MEIILHLTIPIYRILLYNDPHMTTKLYHDHPSPEHKSSLAKYKNCSQVGCWLITDFNDD